MKVTFDVVLKRRPVQGDVVRVRSTYTKAEYIVICRNVNDATVLAQVDAADSPLAANPGESIGLTSCHILNYYPSHNLHLGPATS